jgi:hypothetical protein
LDKKNDLENATVEKLSMSTGVFIVPFLTFSRRKAYDPVPRHDHFVDASRCVLAAFVLLEHSRRRRLQSYRAY